MKERFKRFFESGGGMFIVLLLCALFGVVDGGAMTADAINPPGGGAVDTGAMVKSTEARVDSPDLLLDTIDPKVAKIRPYDVVVDTIARQITDIRTSDNQTIRHYAIDVIDLTATLTTAVTYTAGANLVSLSTSNNGIFACEQTIFVPAVSGYLPDGTTVDTSHCLMLYVVGKDSAGKPQVTAVNGRGSSQSGKDIPTIAANSVLVRGGRAGSETQIQTDAYSGVPTDFEQYLQKFMAQVEMSDIFERASKEVDWQFNDVEEEAVFDMKRVQNVSYLLGTKARIKIKNAHSTKAEDVYFTGGIWAQAGKEFDFGGTAPTSDSLVSLMKAAFTGTSSGKKKLLIMGSDFLEAMEKVEYTKVVYPGTQGEVYGIEFSSIISKFGRLMGIHDKSFDDMGMADKAFVLDADFLRKWTMGWRVNNFDFRKSGQSDADGRGLIEICGLVLKNPKAHMRVSL